MLKQIDKNDNGNDDDNENVQLNVKKSKPNSDLLTLPLAL